MTEKLLSSEEIKMLAGHLLNDGVTGYPRNSDDELLANTLIDYLKSKKQLEAEKDKNKKLEEDIKGLKYIIDCDKGQKDNVRQQLEAEKDNEKLYFGATPDSVYFDGEHSTLVSSRTGLVVTSSNPDTKEGDEYSEQNRK